MEHKEFRVRIPWPSLRLSRSLVSVWLPSRGNVLFTLVMIAVLLWAQSAGAVPFRAESAASTSTIAYQGRLADSSGNPLTQTLNMSFRLYKASTGGAPLWTEQWTGSNGVQVSDGLFNVMLGSLTPIPQSVITGNSTLFLGITVGTDDEMSPRVQLGSVPFAVQALTVPDGSITKAKLAGDVSLVPPDGSITTAKIADGAVTEAKLGILVPKLLGYETCDICGAPSESSVQGWSSVKGANAQDIIEVTVSSHGGPLLASITNRFFPSPATGSQCGIAILEGTSQIRFAVIEGFNFSSSDFMCSGLYLFTDLPAGTYTFRAMAHFLSNTNVTWNGQRQIAVFEF